MYNRFDYMNGIQWESKYEDSVPFHYQQENMYNCDWSAQDDISLVYTSDIESQRSIKEYANRYPSKVRWIHCRKFSNGYEDWKVQIDGKFFLKRNF